MLASEQRKLLDLCGANEDVELDFDGNASHDALIGASYALGTLANFLNAGAEAAA